MAMKDMTGMRFGKLVVTHQHAKSKDGAIWHCVCDCGETRNVAGTGLRAGRNKSCGCASPRFSKERLTTHGMSKTRTYKIWAHMLQRCSNQKSDRYKDYGGRGIKVCDEWLVFDNFLSDMGECKDSFSIDRIDNDGDYEPLNCRWADAFTQCNNTRKNRFLTSNGKTMTIANWARELKVKPNSIVSRLRKGWSDSDAVSKNIDRLTRLG